MGEQIFTKEELLRINQSSDGSLITVDVHGMSRAKAMRFVKNLIALNFRSHNFNLEVIHGYNHGTLIMEALRESEISPRVNGISTLIWNPGVTVLSVA